MSGEGVDPALDLDAIERRLGYSRPDGTTSHNITMRKSTVGALVARVRAAEAELELRAVEEHAAISALNDALEAAEAERDRWKASRDYAVEQERQAKAELAVLREKLAKEGADGTTG